MSGRFYLIRHVMTAIYVLAGRLGIQVPSSPPISIMHNALQNFKWYFPTSKPRSPKNIKAKYQKL